MAQKNKPKPTPEQLAALREKVIADPNTRKIADSLQVDFDAYVEQVMKYAANPNMEPQVEIAPDHELVAAGIEVPDPHKLKAFLQEYADAAEISTKSKFADPKSQRERVTGAIPNEPAATAKPDEIRDDLKQDVDRVRTSQKYKKF